MSLSKRLACTLLCLGLCVACGAKFMPTPNLYATARQPLFHAQEVDVTLDYRIKKGWLRSFWLRLRGSWLHDEAANRDGTDFRVILRYDVPVI